MITETMRTLLERVLAHCETRPIAYANDHRDIPSLLVQIQKMLRPIHPHFVLTQDMVDDIRLFSESIQQHLHHKMEDSGTRWEPALTIDMIYVQIPNDIKTLPLEVLGTYEGGCDANEDTPHHRCGPQCTEVRLSFKAVLYQVVSLRDALNAAYSIEME